MHDDSFRPGPSGYWTQAWLTTVNAVVNAATFGRKLVLEGRRSARGWHNWTRGERSPARTVATPRTEEEIIDEILRQPRLRCVGSGHSFNAGVRGEAIVSLDNYTGFIHDFDHDHLPADPELTYVRARAGTRVRDVTQELTRRGLAIGALPSHDAQSLAGILSTDVHGTGRDIGFVSASVVGLRVIDGRGNVHDVWRDDPLFRAAIGGIGAVGVITEVSLQCVPAFNVRQVSRVIPVSDARDQFDDLLAGHDHMSFYVFPFARDLQLHTWDRTTDGVTPRAALREFKAITFAAMGAAWMGDAIAWSKRLPRYADWMVNRAKHTDLVLPSAAGFNRSIYHMHQELEFALPITQTWTVIDQLTAIYESMYRGQRMPYTLLEVRFTPANGTQSYLSPGAGEHACVWVTMVSNQSSGFADYFDAVEHYLLTTDARPHLGKWCERYTSEDLARVHGDAFTMFRTLMETHDPDRRFENAFTTRLFGEPAWNSVQPIETTPTRT